MGLKHGHQYYLPYCSDMRTEVAGKMFIPVFIAGMSSRASAKISLVGGFPLSSVWVPFTNMHNGRVDDLIYCDNLGEKWVPPY